MPITLPTSVALPVVIRGIALRAAKRFTDGTHRCASPEETLARIQPHLAACGITRLADISGLDRVGVTTVLALRPNAKRLVTSSGKGFTAIAATVSAAMEGIELHHAENPRLDETVAPFAELEADGVALDRATLPLVRRHHFSDRRPEVWVRGWDLLGGRDVLVPFLSATMVTHPAQRPRLAQQFRQDSNGLASGNHLLEAACAAVYELVERDAVTCHRLAEHRWGYRAPLVPVDEVAHPRVRELVGRFAACDLQATLRDCTVDTEVPVYVAHLFDRRARNAGIFAGWGAHLDPEVAMIRALTEAAQSRVCYIAGSRDDIFRCEERQARFEDTSARVARLREPSPTGPGRADRPSEATASFEGDLAVLLAKLRAVGVPQVVLVDLTDPALDIPVVRAIAPALEGYASHDLLPGARAAAFAARAARLTRLDAA
jgi:ribosomal protein S12 methylthiotransferase accessory factor